MKLSIKNRIALYSVLGIASLSFVVFIAIFFTVKNTVYGEIDAKLKFEAKKHALEIIQTQDSVFFAYKDEWLEREHMEVEIYPLFVQLFDAKGNSLDKSPNLYSNSLNINTNLKDTIIKVTKLNEKSLRQIQLPIINQGQLNGYISLGVPLGDAKLVIDTLLNSLIAIYPMLLVITFFTSRLISKITIKPITLIAKRVDEINTTNLSLRVPETSNGDELETLSKAVNELLNRIDEGIKREQQFTADASHQLRTPLAVMKGNLEVLIRKQRQPEEYINSITSSIEKINEMSGALENLLILARFNESNTSQIDKEDIELETLIKSILTNYKQQIITKQLQIDLALNDLTLIHNHKSYLTLIIDNLISNAIKYAFEQTVVNIFITSESKTITITICNNGPVIAKNVIPELFHPFYRSREHEDSTKGYGLGLAIVKKAADALHATVHVNSGSTTCFSITLSN